MHFWHSKEEKRFWHASQKRFVYSLRAAQRQPKGSSGNVNIQSGEDKEFICELFARERCCKAKR